MTPEPETDSPQGHSPEPTVHHHAAVVHGRVLEIPAGGAADDEAAGLLVGFHGYGEDAAAHLEQLQRIPGVERWHRLAVQALHPFYTRKGEIVACWMTSQDREQALEDNIRWVASAIAAARRRLGEPRRVVYAGFSQGVAMAWRAALRSGHPCHGVIALAGDVPPELRDVPWPVHPPSPDAEPRPLPVLLGRGTGDTWYGEAKMETDLEVLRRPGVAVERVVFEGGHEWGEDFLAAAGRFLERVAR